MGIDDRMSYRDFLIWTTAHTAHALNDSIRLALDMHDEREAIQILEHRLNTVAALADFDRPNPETVQTREEALA